VKTSSARAERVLTGLTTVMTLIAAVFVGAWVWQAVLPHPAPDPLAPIHVANWRTLESTSVAAGSATAPVAVTVFSDYQCPFCRKTEGDLRSLERQYPGYSTSPFGTFRSAFIPMPLLLRRLPFVLTNSTPSLRCTS
jgi:hypothetical protein